MAGLGIRHFRIDDGSATVEELLGFFILNVNSF
jgi:hypothetical protein